MVRLENGSTQMAVEVFGLPLGNLGPELGERNERSDYRSDFDGQTVTYVLPLRIINASLPGRHEKATLKTLCTKNTSKKIPRQGNTGLISVMISQS